MYKKLKLAASIILFGASASQAIATTPVPSVVNDLPSQAFSGEQMCFDLSLSNSGDPGYGPYYRVFHDQSLNIDSISMFGSSLTLTDEGIFTSAQSNTLHDSVIEEDVAGIEDLAFKTVVLPVGSVVTGGPTLAANVCITVDQSATIGSDLAFNVQAAYKFGDTATGDNGPIIGAENAKNIKPAVLDYFFDIVASESERVPGSNFPMVFTHQVDVANSKTSSNHQIQAILPTDLQFTGTASLTGGTSCVVQSEPSTSAPGGNVDTSCASITGGPSTNDHKLTYSAYIPNILNGATCSTIPINVSTSHNAEFPIGTSLSTINKTDTVTAKHLAVQQSTQTIGNIVPGSTFTVTNDIQVSNFNEASELILSDVLADGLAFVSHSSMSVNSASTSISPVATVVGNTTTVVYDIHDVTGNLAPGTSISIAYQVQVLAQYRSDNSAVNSGDALPTSSSINYDLVAGASACNDASSDGVTVQKTSSTLTIENPKAKYVPGDTVQFKLDLSVPSGDTKDIVFENFLPLPVLKASDVDVTFGSGDIDYSADNTEVLVVDNTAPVAGTNSIKIEFADLSSASSETISVLLDTTISDDPFADGLSLSNLFQASSKSSSNESLLLIKNAVLEVSAPDVSVTLDASSLTNVDAGDNITYTFVATNNGGANAHDITVSALTLSGIEDAVLSTVKIDNSTVASGDYQGSLNDGTFKLNIPLAPSEVLEIVFTRAVSQSVTPRQSIDVTASATWSSLAGNNKPFPAQSDEQTLTVSSPTTTTSILSISPNGSAGTDFVVGDTVTYEVEAVLPESTMPNLDFELALPKGLEYVASSYSQNTSALNGTIDASPSISTTGSVSAGQKVNVLFDSPTSTVVTNDNNTTNNSFSFTVQALVKDVSQNNGGSSKQNKKIVTSLNYTGKTGGDINSQVIGKFAEHTLALTTAVSPNENIQAGDQLTITITLENTGTAPAYDVNVTSPVDANLFDLSTVAQGTTAADFSYNFASPNVTYNLTSGEISPNEQVQFTYTAIVKDNAQSGASYTISASAQGDSQSGNVTGERDNTSSNSSPASTKNPTADALSLTTSTESWTSDSAPVKLAIGEIATYAFTLTLPEGLTQASGANDLIEVTLPAGLSYVSSTATITGVFDSGESITSAQLGAISGSASSVTPTISGQTIGLHLGDTTVSSSDGNAEQLVFTFDVRTNNQTDNNRSDTKSLAARVHYQNQNAVAQSQSTSASATIVEPTLSASLSANTSSVIGGQSVQFTVLATNDTGSNVSNAWDWIINSDIPARLQNVSIVSAELSRMSTDIAACASVISNDINVDASCLSTSDRYLAPGENIEVVFSADVDSAIGFEETVTTSIDFKVTSLPGTNGTGSRAGAADSDTGERTGSGNNNDSLDAVNDLVVMASEDITAGKPSVLLNTSNGNAQIGELVTLSSTFGLPTGSTNDFIYTLDLPTGISYQGATVQINSPSSDFSTSKTPANTFVSGTDPLVFDFGTVVNSSSSAQNIEIIVNLEVDNILANQDGQTRDLNGTLTYQGVSSPAPTATQVINIVEANLEIAQSIVSGAANSDAGDTIRYKTDISNTSNTATAYNVAFVDIMPEGLLGAPDGSGSGTHFVNLAINNPANAVVRTDNDNPLVVGDSSITTTTNTNDTLGFANFDVPANTTLSIEYDVVVSNNSSAGDTLQNNVITTYASTATGGGRTSSGASVDDDDNTDLNNYRESASSTLVLDNMLALQSALNAAHSSNDFSIGEAFALDLRIDVIEGEINSLVLNNQLPDNIAFISSSASVGDNLSFAGSANGSVNGANEVTVNLGKITNLADGDSTNDFVIVTLNLKVENEAANQQGLSLSNSASATGGGASTPASTFVIDIVEPELALVITSDKNQVSLGDDVTYTFMLTPTSGRPNAFDTSMDVSVPSGLTFQAGSAMGPATVNSSDPRLLNLDFGTVTTADGPKVLSFKATVDNNAQIGDTFTVTVQNGQYSSQAGVNADKRSYTLNGSKAIVSGDASFISASQSIEIVNDANSDGRAQAGDTIRITASIVNDGPPVSNLMFTESIPQYSQYVPNSVSASVGSVDDTSGISANIGSFASNASAQIVFDVVINAGVADGALFVAQGQVDSELTIPELTDADSNDANGDQANTLVLGDAGASNSAMYVNQTYRLTNDADNSDSLSPNDVLTISYQITNTGNQDLSNIQLNDTIPAGLSYQNASVVFVDGTANVIAGELSATVTNLAVGESLTLSMQVSIDDPLVNFDGQIGTELFEFDGSFQSNETAALPIDSNNQASDGNQALSFSAATSANKAPEVRVFETWQLIQDIDADGIVDPNDVVRVSMTAVNYGSSDAQNLALTHAIPNMTSFVPSSAKVSKGVISNQTPVQANVGTLSPGESVLLEFDLTVGAFNNGDAISLQGSASGSNIGTILADANANAGDGLQAALVIVSSGAAIVEAPTLVLQSSSDSSTTNNDFIQSEVLTLEYKLALSSGRTNGVSAQIVLPQNMAYVSNSAELSKEFDTSLSSQFDPADINAASSGQFVNVDSQLSIDGQTINLALGDVLNYDNDVNDEFYILRINVNTSSVVPAQSTQTFNLQSALIFSDELNQRNTENSDLLALRLLNRAPVASNNVFATNEDTQNVSLTPLQNDIDADTGQVLRIVSVGNASNGGSFSIVNSGANLLYTPAPDFYGSESIAYQMSDGAGGSSSASIVVNVAALADAPRAQNDTASTNEDTNITVNVLTNDVEVDGETLTLQAVSVDSGMVSIVNNEVLYQPSGNFSGLATVNYTVADTNSDTDIATLLITVNEVNDAPTVSNSTASVNEDETLNINGLTSAQDIDNDPLTVSSASAVNGQVSIINGTALQFVPTSNYHGSASISYVISDGRGGTASATVNVTVVPVNDAPVISLATTTTQEDTPVMLDVLGNTSDVENDTLTIQSVSATNGLVVNNGDGTITFTPNEHFSGQASVSVTVSDGNGGIETAEVAVNVSEVNDAPTVSPISASTSEDEDLGINILENAQDIDEDTLSISVATATNGSVTIGNSGIVIFEPTENFFGQASINFTIIDGRGGSVDGSVAIEVLSVNDVPVFETILARTDLTDPVVINVLDFVSDVEDTDAQLTITSATSDQGTVTISSNGSITFVANEGFEGTASITVCVSDTSDATQCTVAQVNVNNPNTAPVVQDITASVEEDGTVPLNLSGVDNEGDMLTYQLVSQPSNGELVGELPNVVFNPDPNFSGDVTFSYTAFDGQETSNVARVTIIVGGENDPPLAIDDAFEITSDDTMRLDVLANDSDADGDNIRVIGATANIGELRFDENGIDYTPLQGFVGTATIDYTISDPSGLKGRARVVLSTNRPGDEDLPVISVPDDVFVDANALFTKIDLGVASAVDKFGNPLPVSLVDGVTLYEPGTNTAFWIATDSDGNQGIASQAVNVRPLVSFSKDQSVLEGRQIKVRVNLNGASPEYPLVVPYTVTGTADSSDHNLIDGELVIQSGSEGIIEFESFSDEVVDASETIILTLAPSLNRGNQFTHTVTIAEGNVNPDISLFAQQDADRRVLISNTGGDVLIESTVVHPDPTNEYIFTWESLDATLTDISQSDEEFSFTPSTLESGIYRIKATIVDADDPGFSDVETIYIEVRDILPSLSADIDSDGDGTPDSVEGLGDTDRDGIPDYLDPIPECNVLPEEVEYVDGYLVEGDPGVCLRLGTYAIKGRTGGAKIIDEDIEQDANLVADPEVTNTGGVFDFIAYGLPEKGISFRIAMPQLRPIPSNAVYRKFTSDNEWVYFDESGDNNLWSTAGEPGYCPPTGGDVWTPGLSEGHWCVQVEIVDGGPNDADGLANGTIVDPGGVGVVLTNNALPEAVNDTVEVLMDTSIDIFAINNDIDTDSDLLSITSASVDFGEVFYNDMSISYTPPFGFIGQATILYGISDGNGGSDLGEITVTVFGNEPPIAVDDSVSMQVNQSVVINVLNNDSDPDGDSITLIDAQSSVGTVAIVSDTSLRFTPPNNFVGDVSIAYTLTDPDGAQASAIAVVTVEPELVRIENKKGGALSLSILMILLWLGIYRRMKLAQARSSMLSINRL